MKNRYWIYIVVIIVLIQFIPLKQTNPPVVREPNWDSPRTRALAKRTCFNCHSNETVWPWYSKVAPVSWLVTHDVNEGRHHFNVSEWYRTSKEEATEEFLEKEMPPALYLLMHPEAKLNSTERSELLKGLEATFGKPKDHH